MLALEIANEKFERLYYKDVCEQIYSAHKNICIVKVKYRKRG